MKKYEIVIESAVNLVHELREKFGIYDDVIRGTIYLPKEDILADSDFKNYAPEEFFKIVKKNAGKVKTAFATYEEFVRVVEPILKDGKDAIIFTISSALSGTANAFRNYADMILDDYKGRKIFVVDTLKYDSAGALLAIKAAECREKGLSVEETFKWVEDNKLRLHEIGPMDDLSFLAKNGRIAAGKAFFGQLAGVQPVADFTYDGFSKPLGTVKGAAVANKLSLDYLLKTAEDLENQVVIVAHSNRKERAEIFKDQLLKAAKPKEVIICSVGESCAPNIGPGLCAYFYFGDKLTVEREIETKVFQELKEAK